ncbi:MAG: phosphomannomutase/phosphoglucomutase [Candidatus Levybacteria bacterium]|nr:phosphomannomutase/phosphoglucomutase [Candidatus Levybacteria bacterium]
MIIDPSIFKSYDIRGIYKTQLDEEGIYRIVQAIYKVLSEKVGKEKFSVVLSRDMRISSPSLSEIAQKALLDCGIEVIDIGLASTPSFYFAVFKLGADGGIQISASHNPKEWNGLKMVANSPQGLIKIGKSTGMEDVKTISLGQTPPIKVTEGSITHVKDIVEKEVQNSIRIAGNPKIKKFKIVADAANSMGAVYLDELFKHIPGELIRMNFNLDGTFPSHQPDPLNFDTLVDLQKKVIDEKADIGFAPDGDGDRFFFIDENGEIVPPSIITSLVARELLKKNPGAMILFDIRYILNPIKIIEENGGKYDITKVGHAFITEKMHETGAIFAGESSSHFFYKEAGNGEAPIPVILTVLAVMTRENKKLSELTEELRRSYESGEFNFKVSNAKEILEQLKVKYSDGDVSEFDGVAVTYPDWRFSARTSNTEPLLRLNVESLQKDITQRRFNELKDYINILAK